MPQIPSKSLQRFSLTRFSPFRYRNFNIFYGAQTWSLIGNWASDLARSWIVIEMMGKAGTLGFVMMAGALPGLFLYFYGGALADRVQVQKVIVITKIFFSLLAFSLALTLELTQIQLWFLIMYAALEGTLLCFDLPLNAKIIARLVKRKHFQQAITLHSVGFHSARMLGPLVAGIFLATWGPSSVFFFDAISYFIIALLLYRLTLMPDVIQRKPKTQMNLRKLLRNLRNYFRADHQIRFFMLQLLATVLIIIPISVVILRTYLKKKFQLDAGGFGLLFASPAAGSMVGAFIMTFAQPKKPYRNLIFSIPLLIISLSALVSLDSKMLTTIVLFFMGLFSYLCFASLTLSIHMTVRESFRGRISSLIAMGFTSLGPLMSFPIGTMADNIGYRASVYLLLIVYATVSLALGMTYLQSKP